MEWTCVSYPNGCYSRVPDLRVRPVEEMKSCVVFRPNPPKLFMLNLNAWLILELCDGADAQEIAHRYYEKVGSHMSVESARAHLLTGLQTLREQGLVIDKAG